MKRLFYAFAVCAFFTTCFTACDVFISPSFNQSDLYGEWFRYSQIDPNAFEFIYFQEDGYGYTWDEGDDVHKEDLKYHGNGWFTWTLIDNKLTMVNLMDNGGSEIPKSYTISTLNGTSLVYKDGFGDSFSFSKNHKYTID